jgi:multimeric flavodoxin WrbA
MSLNGEMSVTLHATRYMQDVYKKKGDEFTEVLIPKSGKITDEELAKFKEADLVIFATSMYHFLIASQAMEAMQKIGDYMQQNCPDKPCTYFMTSNFLMDNLVHEYIRKWTRRYGMNYIKGISLFSDDIVEEKWRGDLFAWFNNVKTLISNTEFKAAGPMTTKIVISDDTEKTAALAKQYHDAFAAAGATVTDVKMSDYKFTHCLGCQACYTTRKCCIDDQFNDLCKAVEADTDVAVYVGTIENGFYGPLFKRYMDRHVCIGRCPLDDETIAIYAYSTGEGYVSGDEELFRTWCYANTSFGGEVLIDVLEGFTQRTVNEAVTAFNEKVGPYRDFYRAALRTRFAELARVIKNVEPMDYEYFERLGAYEIEPQNQNCRAIHSVEEAKKAVEMKSMPVRIYRTQGGNMDADIPDRRTDRRSLIEKAQNPLYRTENKETETKSEKKGGFKLFGGKK